VERCAKGKGEPEGIACDDLSRFLTLFQNFWDMGIGRDHGGMKLGKHPRASLGLVHQCEQGRMFESEADVSVGGFG